MSKHQFPIDLGILELMAVQVIPVYMLQVYVVGMPIDYEWYLLAIKAFEAILDHWHVVEFHYKRIQLILDSGDRWKSHKLPFSGLEIYHLLINYWPINTQDWKPA